MSESCRCDAQYCSISCTCLPGKVASPGSNAQPSSEYTYSHNVDTCPCGICYKSRVDSGTQDAYMKRVRAKVDEVLNDKHKPFCQCAKCKGFSIPASPLPDAKAIFAALGTPHDSKCSHGVPFYTCMSCSH